MVQEDPEEAKGSGMSNIRHFENRAEKVRGLRKQIAEFNRGIDEVISTAEDAALVEVHSMLRREMAVGRIPLHYADLLEKLHGEIARRALNVVPLHKGGVSA